MAVGLGLQLGLRLGWSDVTESMVTIRSPFCGYNTIFNVSS